MIFVFGSNKSGIHGAGAAKYAHEHKMAEWGVGEGITGLCYALPTKGYKIEFIPLEQVEEAVNAFLHFARKNPGVDFQVTCVGCGLGGFTHEQIAPLFSTATDNCYFDEVWRPWLKDNKKYWGTF